MMNNENGRSMVEMLGVLAIIGVLSVAGIAGYSMAMKKYKTNEYLNAASQLVILAQAKKALDPTTATANLSDLGANTSVAGLQGNAIAADCSNEPCTVTITNGDDDAVAKAIEASGAYFTITS